MRVDYVDAKMIEGKDHESAFGRESCARRWIRFGFLAWIVTTIVLIAAVQCLVQENRALRNRAKTEIQSQEK